MVKRATLFIEAHKFPFIAFLFLGIGLFWLNSPVGTYDLSGDLWEVGNEMESRWNRDAYPNDYFMSTPALFSMNLPFFIVHGLPYKFFGDWESYTGILNAVYFFSGSMLLYLLAFYLTAHRFISFFASLLFSCATVFFSTGDIFAFIPVYGTVNKSLGFIWVMAMLLVALWKHLNVKGLAIISLMNGILAWLHPITFMGPGISLFLIYTLLFILSSGLSRRKKAAGLFLAVMISMAIVGPYTYTFVGWGKQSIGQNLTPEERERFAEAYAKMRQGKPIPDILQPLKRDLNLIRGYRIMLALAAVILAVSLLYRRNKEIWIIAGTGLLSVGIIYFCTALEILLFKKDGITVLYPIIRNVKWLYFFSFLMILSTIKPVMERFRKRSQKQCVGLCLGCILILCIGAPLSIHSQLNVMIYGKYSRLNDKYTYNPLYRTWYHSFTGLKAIEKLGGYSGLLPDKFRTFTPGPDELRIQTVNESAEELVGFIQTLTGKPALAGPKWLRYKARANMAFCNEDGAFFLVARDRTYFKWNSQKEAYETIVDILTGSGFRRLDSLSKQLDAEYLVVPKFSFTFDDEKNRYRFVKKQINPFFESVYENEGFAVFRPGHSQRNIPI